MDGSQAHAGQPIELSKVAPMTRRFALLGWGAAVALSAAATIFAASYSLKLIADSHNKLVSSLRVFDGLTIASSAMLVAAGVILAVAALAPRFNLRHLLLAGLFYALWKLVRGVSMIQHSSSDLPHEDTEMGAAIVLLLGALCLVAAFFVERTKQSQLWVKAGAAVAAGGLFFLVSSAMLGDSGYGKAGPEILDSLAVLAGGLALVAYGLARSPAGSIMLGSIVALLAGIAGLIRFFSATDTLFKTSHVTDGLAVTSIMLSSIGLIVMLAAGFLLIGAALCYFSLGVKPFVDASNQAAAAGRPAAPAPRGAYAQPASLLCPRCHKANPAHVKQCASCMLPLAA